MTEESPAVTYLKVQLETLENNFAVEEKELTERRHQQKYRARSIASIKGSITALKILNSGRDVDYVKPSELDSVQVVIHGPHDRSGHIPSPSDSSEILREAHRLGIRRGRYWIGSGRKQWEHSGGDCFAPVTVYTVESLNNE